MTDTGETRVISSQAAISAIPTPPLPPLDLPVAFKGYSKDAVERHIMGLEQQIDKLRAQNNAAGITIGNDQQRIGRLEQENENLRNRVGELEQAASKPMEEFGRNLGREIQTVKDTYEQQKKAELEQAHAQAAKIVDEARRESETKLADINDRIRQSTEAIRQAEQKSEQASNAKLEEAHAKAAKIIADAGQQAEQVKQEADKQAADVKLEADKHAADVKRECDERIQQAADRERESRENVTASLNQLQSINGNVQQLAGDIQKLLNEAVKQ